MAGLVAHIAYLGALRAIARQVTSLVAVVARLAGGAATIRTAARYMARLVAVVARRLIGTLKTNTP